MCHHSDKGRDVVVYVLMNKILTLNAENLRYVLERYNCIMS